MSKGLMVRSRVGHTPFLSDGPAAELSSPLAVLYRGSTMRAYDSREQRFSGGVSLALVILNFLVFWHEQPSIWSALGLGVVSFFTLLGVWTGCEYVYARGIARNRGAAAR
jgi:hypothetical protein